MFYFTDICPVSETTTRRVVPPGRFDPTWISTDVVAAIADGLQAKAASGFGRVNMMSSEVCAHAVEQRFVIDFDPVILEVASVTSPEV